MGSDFDYGQSLGNTGVLGQNGNVGTHSLFVSLRYDGTDTKLTLAKAGGTTLSTYTFENQQISLDGLRLWGYHKSTTGNGIDNIAIDVSSGSGIFSGDFNNDDVVDAADYTVWRDNLGSNVTLPNDLTPGTVTVDDYNDWKAHFGASYSMPPVSLVASTVPEPSSVTLVLLGLAGLTGAVRWRK